MEISAKVRVRCVMCGAEEWVYYSQLKQTTVTAITKEVTKRIRGLGWKVTRENRAYCPVCKKMKELYLSEKGK